MVQWVNDPHSGRRDPTPMNFSSDPPHIVVCMFTQSQTHEINK